MATTKDFAEYIRVQAAKDPELEAALDAAKVEADAEQADFNAQFALLVRMCRGAVEPFLTEMFGERCPDFEPDCECCKRWAALDVLTVTPGG